MRPAVPLYWRLTPAECRPFFRNPVSSTIRTASGLLNSSQRNGAVYPAQRLPPNEPGPTDAAPDKEPLPPSTQPTASHSCAHSRSTSLVNTPDLAHEALSAQTDPQSSHAPATTHARNPILASPWQGTKNYIPERIQFITYLQL